MFQQLSLGFKHVVTDIQRLGLFGGALLEIGCNAGYALKAFQGIGWEVAGVEVNAATRGLAQEKVSSAIYEDLDEVPEHQAFNVILLSHLLEHITEPVGLLKKIVRRLKPGGLVYVKVPNYGSYSVRYFLKGKWPSFLPLQHVWYFDRRSLQSLFSIADLTPVHIYTRQRLSFRASTILKAALKAPVVIASRCMPYDGNELVGIFSQKCDSR